MSSRNLILACSTILWLLIVVVGLTKLWSYSLSPGTVGGAPERWPASSPIRLEPGRFTLVVVAHPQCACSRATIGELAELMARANGRVTAYVLFAQLAGFDDRWVETDLWHRATAIPGVTVVRDALGTESHRFGAVTSGQTMLYGLGGGLLFSGGITSARGHFGDNEGLAAILSFIGSGASDRQSSPVFGCPLFDRV